MSTLLLIEDSPTHRRQVREALEPAGLFEQILEAEDGFQGLKRLLADPVDVVLCDFEMPGLDGGKLLKIKESHPQGQGVPLLFLSASSSVERRVRLLEGGACDLIEKPFHPAELVARLRLHLKIKRLQDELRDKNEMLSQLSTTDALTGLRTRRYLNDLLRVEWLRARRYGTPLAVAMADVDRFKDVNDAHGHPAGDAVLRGIGELLLRTLRATDTAARLGGDEMLVVMPQNSVRGAAIMADRWRARVAETGFETATSGPLHATISAGIAAYDSAQKSPDDLIAAADAALYRAKNRGRNRVATLEPQGRPSPGASPDRLRL